MVWWMEWEEDESSGLFTTTKNFSEEFGLESCQYLRTSRIECILNTNKVNEEIMICKEVVIVAFLIDEVDT